MARPLIILAGIAALASAAGLYALKHDTRQIEDRVRAVEREIERAESDIAVLKAERSYLGRPERIEALARKNGLGPVRAAQIEASLDLEQPEPIATVATVRGAAPAGPRH
jgi:cell division protein FtsL